MADAVMVSADPAESARRYYKRVIADRSGRWNICYKALFLLDFCQYHRLHLRDDIWITAEDLIEHIIAGYKSGERNSRRAGNNSTADWFACQLLNFEDEIVREKSDRDEIDGQIIFEVLCRLMPGAKVDLARHPAELR